MSNGQTEWGPRGPRLLLTIPGEAVKNRKGLRIGLRVEQKIITKWYYNWLPGLI